MPVEVVVPQIGEAISELTIVSWLKQEGDPVEAGEPLFEVDSDKAIVEVEAFASGTLAQILAPAGSSVLPQQVVAIIQVADEAVPEPPTAAPTAAFAEPTRDRPKITPVAQRMASDLGLEADQIAGSGPGGRIVAADVRRIATQRAAPDGAAPARLSASPKARRLAREMHVELDTLTGSGIDGMIIVRDVMAAAEHAQAAPVRISGAVPLPKLRQVAAARVTASKQQVPHFYLMVDVNMTQVNALRAYCKDKHGWERPPTYTDIMVRACALALAEMPSANVSYAEGGLVARERVNIGIAVNTDDGLVVPTLPDADTLSLRSVATALRELIARARSNRLRAADLGQKSMVISNLGMYAVDAFIAIIDMPDPMILAVGRVADKVAPLDGEIAIQPMCTLALSVDHRALDGVAAAQFLERVRRHLEQPFEIMG